jgi:hypothetical protein
MSKKSNQCVRLRVSQHTLKQGLMPEARDLLGQILRLEDDEKKRDIINNLIGDSLNRFVDAQAPSFSHLALQHTFGMSPSSQGTVGTAVSRTGRPVTEGKAENEWEERDKPVGTVGQENGSPENGSPATNSEVKPGESEKAQASDNIKEHQSTTNDELGDGLGDDDSGADEDWKPNPQFAHFIQ